MANKSSKINQKYWDSTNSFFSYPLKFMKKAEFSRNKMKKNSQKNSSSGYMGVLGQYELVLLIPL
jgi:hypothetical protein